MTDSLIYDSRKSKVFCREEGGVRTHAVKVLNYEFPTPDDITQFHNEFDIIQGLTLSGVRRAIRKTRENNRHVLIMEWVAGQSLKEAFRGKSGDILDALHIAIAVAGALAEIHGHRIIHKDITPNNVLVDLQERQVWLIDFGISTNLNLKQAYVGNPERIEGSLAYISPEQTGRMNRTLDDRTDLYSFGVTLYEMLAGEVPFAGTDPIGVVHAHLAQMPVPLRDRNPAVPQVLSDIVARLLAKNADQRYQSALGLRHDLMRCLDLYQEQGIDTLAFPLGEADFSRVFRLPQRLYGREAEVTSIIRAFDDCAAGARKLLLVGGQSGTGKTALVHEVHQPITAGRGHFCSGKFDQFQRATPYFAFLAAFGGLIDVLLTGDEAHLSALRSQLQDAVGEEGRVLTNVLPNLAHLIGEQPAVAEVGGAEAQQRFHYVFRKFLRVLTTADHPIVIFIDDLQWADSASLDLLRVLMTDPEGGHLLVICAYRENEVSAAHPFIRTVDDIAESGLAPDRISVENLAEADLVALLSDALAATPAQVSPLARLVHDKTQGNAFFATQFLSALAEEHLLQFDYPTSRWVWDTERIAQKNISNNVVDLMAAKVLRLEVPAQDMLKLAACLGNQFDLETLTWISKTDVETVNARLKSALGEGLILPLGKGLFKFSHDRVQQAVYSLIAKNELVHIHLNIGRLLQGYLATAPDTALVFEIANQLNLGSALLNDPDEIINLAKMNLDAGRSAKLNSAFPTALDYLARGISLMEGQPNAWATHYSLSLAMYTEATEAAYLSGQFDQMEGWFAQILDRAQNTLDKVKPYEIRILALKAQNRFKDSIDTGLDLLDQLGEKFPRNPHKGHVFADLALTALALRGRSNADLMALPLMTSPEKSAVMRIIADITSSVYWGMPNLVPLIVFRMVRLSLRYGNHPVSCFAYGCYGVLMCGVLGAMREGYRFGQLALDLLEKLNAKEWKAQIYVTPYALIFHWNEHVRNTLRPLQQSFQIGMETGLVEFACVNTNLYCIQSFLCGRPLDRVEEETRAYSTLYRQMNQETNLNYNEVFRQAMLNLMGQSADPVTLTGACYDEVAMLSQNQDRSDKTGTFFIHFNKVLLGYYFQRYDQALIHAAQAHKLLDAVLSKFEIPNLAFYEALTLLAVAEHSRGTKRWVLIAKARVNMARLKRWSRFAPQNYLHKYDLCTAELARIKGRDDAARLAYDRAIAGASHHDYLHEQALGYELAGRFYATSDRAVLAEFHLKAAYNAYREWGAKAKLRNLVETFPKVLSSSDQGTGSALVGTTLTSVVQGAALDIATVLKASTTISGEVVPQRLLTVLMRIVLESAGAQRGFLLLDAGEGLQVQALGEDGGDVVEVMQSQPLHSGISLSVPMVRFVHRTAEPVIVADAARDQRFREGPARLDAKSILCVPITNRGKCVGVLYLENNLTTGAFTRDRVDLLTLLSGQIAVSIDNAMLYQQLEQKVAERTAELEQEKQRTDDLLLNILPAETAKELKLTGHSDARHYDRVTVLFTDFEGFTDLSARLTPAELVDEIDVCFKAFDLIVEKHRVEKIKTVGDAYMAAGGVPVPNSTHAENVVNAALDMRDFMQQRSADRQGDVMGIRIGVHTGPVVAGIVGLKKFQYDLWGETVNIASRMESAGEVGQVNLSQATYELVRDKFDISLRGAFEVKGKGKIPMYFANRRNLAQIVEGVDERKQA
ncbi:MAG: adenylate/guanylate cyclase domain-containing protein [Microgenomates group bacterium]